MSSHREAPEIAKDPVADGTDVYAFVSPDKPDTVTLIANFIPLQQPNGGPNFYEFGDDVLYEIHISNRNSHKADISYQFRFHTRIRNDKTFLYNTGPIDEINSENWNRPQFYSIARKENGKVDYIARGLTCPPVNVGTRSTKNYQNLSDDATHRVGPGVFYAGQRADAFHVDLGSIFDLGALRPFQDMHAIPLAAMDGINAVQAYNVHMIAMQVPIRLLTRDGSTPKNVNARKSVIGVWATASRRKARTFNHAKGAYEGSGPYVQVSRLANPLVNEVIIPMAEKDTWNARAPKNDAKFDEYVLKPELAGLLPVLYPNGTFDNLKAYKKPRADIKAILHTGIPKGIIDGFQNYTGPGSADLLRLNVAVPPSDNPSEMGILGGDLAGFPNGRRVRDDVVAIELQAIAGATIPLVDKTYTPDGAASVLNDGTKQYARTPTLDVFPYLGLPGGGFQTQPGDTTAQPTNPG